MSARVVYMVYWKLNRGVLEAFTMAVNGSVVWNKQLVQTWFNERPDLYPGHSNWRDYEIVDFLKDDEIIKSL